MNELTDFQFALSTAEDEENVFSGQTDQTVGKILALSPLQTGTYRVVDGQLVLISTGIPFGL